MKSKSQWGVHVSCEIQHGTTAKLVIEFYYGRQTNLLAEQYFAAESGDTTMANHWHRILEKVGEHEGDFLDRSYSDPRFTIEWLASTGMHGAICEPQNWHSPNIVSASPHPIVVRALARIMAVKARQPGDSLYQQLPVVVALTALKPMHVTRNDDAGVWLKSPLEPHIIESPAEKLATRVPHPLTH